MVDGSGSSCAGETIFDKHRADTTGEEHLNLKRMRLYIAAAVLVSFGGFAAGEQHNKNGGQFDEHKLIRVDLGTQRELRTMLAIGATPWACRVNLGLQEFSVSPEQLETLDEAEFEYEVLVDNVQRLFDEEREHLEQLRTQLGIGWFDVYRTWPEVNDYIDELVALRPDLVEKLTVGTSYEGRTIYGMRISAPGDDDRVGVLFNGCQHAREWISVMVPMYIADRLVRDYDSSPEIQAIMQQVEFFIVPIVNPDGYEYTYASGGNRMWRKNRRVNVGGSFGVDLNRNWDIDWNGGNSTSTNPTSDVYVGEFAMSEPETQAMAQFIDDRPNIAAHVDFHNFSEVILQPWGYTSVPPADFEIIDDLGAQMSQAIFDVHGVFYPHGTPGQLLYFASGIFPDWSYDQYGILGYTIELRPATFQPGFLLPPEEIVPTSEENFAAAMVMAQFAAQGVAFSHNAPSFIESNVTTPIEVQVNAITSGPLDESSALLFSRIGSGSFNATPMAPAGDGVFSAELPPVACGDVLEYYFEITAESGLSFTAPTDAPDAVYDVEGIDILFADNFDDDLGWTVGAPDDDATTGIWERANPVGTSVSGQQVQPNAPFVGSACYITGQHPGGGAGANDVDFGKTTLFSPVLDLSETNDALISYWRWYSNHAGANPFNDLFEVDISNDGGQTWVNVETVGPAGEQVMGGWYWHEFAVSSFLTPTNQVQVRFVASDYDPQALVEAAVDAFLVTPIDCEVSCPADLTGDDIVDVSDLLVLLGAWGSCSGNCPADLNGDGEVGVSDLLMLLSAWGECD